MSTGHRTVNINLERQAVEEHGGDGADVSQKRSAVKV